MLLAAPAEGRPPGPSFVVESWKKDAAALAPADAAFHRAHLALLDARAYAGSSRPEEDEEPYYVYQRLAQTLLPALDVVVAGGSTEGGHHFLSKRPMVATEGRVLFGEARTSARSDELLRVDDIALCPVELLAERARMFDGQPDLEKLHAMEEKACRRLAPALRKALLERRDAAAVRDAVRLLLSLAGEGLSVTIVEKLDDVADGKLHDLLTRGPGPAGRWEAGAAAPRLAPVAVAWRKDGVKATGVVALDEAPGWKLAAFTLDVGPAGLLLELRHLGHTVVLIE